MTKTISTHKKYITSSKVQSALGMSTLPVRYRLVPKNREKWYRYRIRTGIEKRRNGNRYRFVATRIS
ncbi:hypothetical protein HanIR_Chr16g0788181 [Helianthus annuus]|nr:hypothetical protein HanIR_Chr16g0788181 [Helianthus annuus]